MFFVGNLTFGQIIVTDTFNYTGSVQSFTVPAGVDSITVDLRGAQGGRAYVCGSIGGTGGYGGRTTGTISVSPGDVIYIYVGGQGSTAASSIGGAGGYNGGAYGNNHSNNQSGGGGGGGTDIRLNGTSLTNRIAVAGGGGGASCGSCSASNGGHAGGLTGVGGTNCCSGVNPTGGTQSAGGSGGSYSGYCTASSGSLGSGGNACSPSGGGGGGGGYYGGGGGAWASGGGGSSYIISSAVNYALVGASNTGNGIAYITYKRCSLPTIDDPISFSPHSRQVTFSNVNINSSGSNVAFVSPGQSITLAFNYTITQNGTYCPGCVSQYYIGIYGFWQDCFRNSGGYCNCSGSESYSITAPTTPGIYYFTQGRTLNFTCATGNTTVSSGTDGIAAIIVRETYSSSVTDETCVGDLNGSIVMTPDSATTGNTYNWSTGNSTNTLSSIGAGIYTVTSSDSYGCFQIDTIEVFTDTIAPIADAFESATIYLDATGNAIVSASSLDSASSDACSLTFTLSDSTFNCADTGVQNITFYATDPGGLIGSDNIQLTILDTVAPNVITQPLTLNLGASGIAVISASSVDNGSADACGIDAMAISKDSFDCSDIGINSVTLYVMDNNGNIDSGEAIVTVIDNIAPVVITKNLNLFIGSSGSVSILASDLDSASSDNCGIDSLYASTTSFTCSDVGSNTVTLYASDADGNVDSASATVSVTDTTTPSLFLYNSKTIYLDGSGMATINIDTLDSASFDNCNYSFSLTNGYSGPLNIANGTTTGGAASIVKFESGGGAVNYNSSIGTACNENWYALGSLCDEGSTLNSPDSSYKSNTNSGATWDNTTPGTSYGILVVDLASVKSIEAMSVFQMFSDGKTTHIRAFSHPSSDTISPSTNDAGWSEFLTSTAVGAGGISSGYAYNPLQLSFSNIQSRYVKLYLYNSGIYGNSSYIELRSIKLFGSDITKTFSCSDVGSQPLTIHATDSSGNSDSAYVNIIVIDTVRPVVLTKSATIYLGATGIGTINVTTIDSGSSDACGIDTMYLSKDSFSCADIGVNTITLFAIDVNGNLDSNQAFVTIEDNIPPTVFTQNIVVALDFNGDATISASMVDSASSDTCGIDTLWLNNYSFDCSDIGVNTVTLFAADVYGNIDSASAIVTIIDTTPPTLYLQNITVYLDSIGQISISSTDIDSASFDACGIISMSLNDSLFDCSNIGLNNPVTLTALDANGNSKSDTVYATVLDTIAPKVITNNLVVYLDSFGSVAITPQDVDQNSWDSCGVDTLYLDVYAFNCSDIGSNTVILTAVDIYGNTSSSPSTVTVMDTIAPEVITQNISIYLNASGQYNLSPNEVDNGSWDSCGIATFSLDTSSFSCSDTGVFSVQLTVTDVNGNQNSAIAQVTLSDTSSPNMLTQSITIYLDASGDASITPNMIDDGSNDNCAIDTLYLDEYDFTCADTTSQIVTLIGIDKSGNTSSANAVVTILDTAAPTIVTQNLTLYLNQDGEASVSAASVDNGTFDNCAVDSIWISDTLFTCADTINTQVITFFARDVSGNVKSSLAYLDLYDTIAPTVSAQNLVIYLDSFGDANIFPSQVDSNSLDNCGIDSSWISQNTYDCSNVGDTVTVLLFIKDNSGNVASDSATMVTLDTIAPQVISQNITVYLDSFGSASISASMIDNGTWDACGVDTLYLNQYSFDCGSMGVNSILLFAADIHGNISSTNASVTVFDTIAPAIALLPHIVYLDSFGSATITYSDLDNGTWDSCGIASIVIDSSNFTCVSHGDTISILFTATDVNGNISEDSTFVVILDTLAPAVFAGSTTVYLDSSGQFILDASTVDSGSYDNCTLSSIYLSDSVFSCANVDSTWTVWFVAVDSFFNVDSIQIQITVLDTIAPEITCQDSIILNNDTGQCGGIVSFSWPAVWDNCSIDTLIQIDTTGLDSGMFFPVGVTTLTYAVFDQSGNSDTCSIIVEIIDTETPVLVCISDTSICDSIFTFDPVTYQDNCAGLDVVQIAGIESGLTYPVGITVNTFAVTDLYGNTDTCSFEVLRFDYPSLAEAGIDQLLCENPTTDLTATAPIVGNGVWSQIIGSAIIANPLSATTAISGMDTGTYVFEWSISNGVCPVDRDSITIVNFSNASVIDAGLDQILCDTNATNLNATATIITAGYWTSLNSTAIIDDSLSENSLISGLALGDYTFVWNVKNGVCAAGYDTVSVSVHPLPIVTANSDQFIFPPTAVELIATSDIATSFAWFDSENNPIGSNLSVSVSPSSTTHYVVIGTTDAGCINSDTMMVGVNDDLEIPTAFTPDGDGYNDVWNIKELANYPDCNVSIYNRWGNKMFESDGYGIPWDGTYNSEQLPSGAYFFVINLNVGEVKPLTGSITIIK